VLTREWMVNTQAFVDHVFSLSPDSGLAKCPCNKCQNCSGQVKIDTERHLCKFGFMPNYERWYKHGESQRQEAYNLVDSFTEHEDRMEAMMDDFVEQVENAAEVLKYFDLHASSKEPLHGATTLSQVAAVIRLMAIKSKYNFSVSCYNDLVDLILDILPKPHKFLEDFYYSKKLLAGLEMPYQKIHVCENNCMLFWKNNENLKYRSFCKKCRYKKMVNKNGSVQITSVPVKVLRYLPLKPRLQKLYLSQKTAKHMRWHKEGIHNNTGCISHPFDSTSWKALDHYDPSFARDPRNVRVGLATDGCNASRAAMLLKV
jgi:hypothetical protein